MAEIRRSRGSVAVRHVERRERLSSTLTDGDIRQATITAEILAAEQHQR